MPFKDKEARTRYNREYYKTHSKEIKAKVSSYAKGHADETRERNRRYRENNREKARDWARRANLKWRTKNRARFNELIEQWAEKNPEKRAAHYAVRKALKEGELLRLYRCRFCGKICKPQAHHDDYSKPLEVIWLCPLCHKRADQLRKQNELLSSESGLPQS